MAIVTLNYLCLLFDFCVKPFETLIPGDQQIGFLSEAGQTLFPSASTWGQEFFCKAIETGLVLLIDKVAAKGQIMSGCIYEIIDFPKYHQTNLIDFCPGRFHRLGTCDLF